MNLHSESAREQGDARRYAFGAYSDHALEELLTEYPIPNETRFGCYRLSGESRFSDIARRVECDVFDEVFGNAADVMAQEYGRYEESSEFLLIVDRQMAQAVGALRVIHYSNMGFKALNDIAPPPLSISVETVKAYCGIHDWARCWDIATVAVVREHRGVSTGQFVSTSLYGHLYAQALQRGVEHFIAILDAQAFRQLTRTFAIPFAPILDRPPFNYLGSKCSRAAHVQLSHVRPNMTTQLRRVDENTRARLTPHYKRLMDGELLPPLIEVDEG